MRVVLAAEPLCHHTISSVALHVNLDGTEYENTVSGHTRGDQLDDYIVVNAGQEVLPPDRTIPTWTI